LIEKKICCMHRGAKVDKAEDVSGKLSIRGTNTAKNKEEIGSPLAERPLHAPAAAYYIAATTAKWVAPEPTCTEGIGATEEQGQALPAAAPPREHVLRGGADLQNASVPQAHGHRPRRGRGRCGHEAAGVVGVAAASYCNGRGGGDGGPSARFVLLGIRKPA
jgi:hypothetical protein